MIHGFFICTLLASSGKVDSAPLTSLGYQTDLHGSGMAKQRNSLLHSAGFPERFHTSQDRFPYRLLYHRSGTHCCATQDFLSDFLVPMLHSSESAVSAGAAEKSIASLDSRTVSQAVKKKIM